jgi:DNA-binding GntR family transcriptional regulator
MAEAPVLSTLNPPARRPLHETVLTQLLLAVRTGKLRQGERLPEAEIAERLSLSRGTVREAIRRLEQEGLVVTLPHRGAYVASVGAEDAAEIFALRRVLESFAVREAARRASPVDLEGLAALVREMQAAAEAGDRVERVRCDLLFHEQLCRLSGNRLLQKFWSSLALKLWLIYLDPRSQPQPDPVRRAAVHFELVDMLRRRDVDGAATWIERHIDQRGQRAVEELSAGVDP